MKNQRKQAQRLLRAFGEIDDSYIREALERADGKEKQKKARFGSRTRALAALAACLLLFFIGTRILYTGRMFMPEEKSQSTGGLSALPENERQAEGEDADPDGAVMADAPGEDLGSAATGAADKDLYEDEIAEAEEADLEGLAREAALVAPKTGEDVFVSGEQGEEPVPKDGGAALDQRTAWVAGDDDILPSSETEGESVLLKAQRISGIEISLPEIDGFSAGPVFAREGRLEVLYLNQEGEEAFRIIKEVLPGRDTEAPEAESETMTVWMDGAFRWQIRSGRVSLTGEMVREIREKLS